ncbi:helix-turn-helix domain-containing protein [Flavobacteriaceae bacterium XHP0103]|uniref:helix-turn-helix domain-containing protein n=1 Tax=Marixanthotalea marina TaxID=2844359 RepID=UPI002989C57F|nr:helix-turn-helix transcriptional regulator [Marixanthotalea marina]MBU3822311.1 helix-turn-helix domain-containing protein [Marixanthotalea marina]
MINNEAFTERLQKVMEFYNESAASFAERIGVQRSSISHILSGRNKPSLDFVLKILSTYPEVELYWLLNGKGSFPNPTSISDAPANENLEGKNQVKKTESDLMSKMNNDKSIERIIIFYSDGSFKNYQN